MTNYKYISRVHHFLGIINPKRAFISLLMIVLCSVSYAQTVTLPQSRTTIGEVMKEVENQTRYRFFYNDELDTSVKVNFPVREQELTTLLTNLFKDTKYDYKIGTSLIGVKANPNKVTAKSPSNPTQGGVRVPVQSQVPVERAAGEPEQFYTLNGVVVDALTGEPLVDVEIIIRGRDNLIKRTTQSGGAFTTENLPAGEYGITLLSKDHRLKRDQITLSSASNENLKFELEQTAVGQRGGGAFFPSASYTDESQWLDVGAIRHRPSPTKLSLPKFALKTNAVLWATASMNLGFECRLSDKMTLDFPVSYNPWKFSDNKLMRHILLQPEVRYWTRESFNGHFVGFNLIYSFFNIGNVKLPLGLFKGLEKYRYEGNLYGGGISYGYQWMLSNKISIEATAGVGYFYADYDKFNCEYCAPLLDRGKKHYVGLTKLGISLSYFFR